MMQGRANSENERRGAEIKQAREQEEASGPTSERFIYMRNAFRVKTLKEREKQAGNAEERKRIRMMLEKTKGKRAGSRQTYTVTDGARIQCRR